MIKLRNLFTRGFLGKQNQFMTYNIQFNFNQQARQNEIELSHLLEYKLQAKYVKVVDTSGGTSCGQMYTFEIHSDQFKGKTRVEQHQMVTKALGDKLNGVHGYNIKTSVPKE